MTSFAHQSSSSSKDNHHNKHRGPQDKWFVVIHENTSAAAALSVPEYAEFASKGTYFSNYHAITHPSQPNYIAMIAGDTFEPPFYDDNVVDFPNPDRPDANSTIIDLIEARGLSWKVYLENYPSPGSPDEFALFIEPNGVIWDFVVTSGPAAGNYSAQRSTFGPQIGLPEATLIATPNLDGTPGPGQDFTGKIVLVSRGTFLFTDKVKNAQNAGAVGVIIYNTDTRFGTFTFGGFFTPTGTDPTITIPSFGISRAEGLFIVEGVTTDPTSTGFLDGDIATAPVTGFPMYARKHNPFISFLNISTNPERASKLVNAKEFAKDVAKGRVPDFAFYIPNQFNDGHDTGISSPTAVGPLLTNVPLYSGSAFAYTFGLALKTKSFTKDRVIVLTFDENDFEDDANQIYCAFFGDHVKKGHVVNKSYNHYNLLRTIEDSLRVGTLGRNDSTAAPMTGWRKKNK